MSFEGGVVKGSESFVIFRVGPVSDSEFNVVIVHGFELPFFGCEVEVMSVEVVHVIDVFA